MVTLKEYINEKETAKKLIKNFWFCHSGYDVSDDHAEQDLLAWTGLKNKFFFIESDGETVGFLRLASRGAKIDWLEEIFVEPRHQNKGIGSRAVKLAENLVKEYSESMYIEAAARNASAIKLYRKLGYNCLNTVTLRKDFLPDCFDVVRTVTINGAEFEIKRKK